MAKKEKIAGNQHFLLFSTVFSILSEREIIITAAFNLLSANAFDLVLSKYEIWYRVNHNNQTFENIAENLMNNPMFQQSNF